MDEILNSSLRELDIYMDGRLGCHFVLGSTGSSYRVLRMRLAGCMCCIDAYHWHCT